MSAVPKTALDIAVFTFAAFCLGTSAAGLHLAYVQTIPFTATHGAAAQLTFKATANVMIVGLIAMAIDPHDVN